MSKSGDIRECIKLNPGVKRTGIVAKTGFDSTFVAAIVMQRIKAGEFDEDEVGGLTYNEDFKGGSGRWSRGAAPEKKAVAKKVKKKAKKRAEQTAAVAAPPQPPLQKHVRSTFAVLEHVLDLEDGDPLLVAAFNAHKEAIELTQ